MYYISIISLKYINKSMCSLSVAKSSVRAAQVDPGCTGNINFHQLCAGYAVLTKARKLINYRERLGA